ncbi:hypothetical protein D3C72_1928370 [compost metagenome]
MGTGQAVFAELPGAIEFLLRRSHPCLQGSGSGNNLKDRTGNRRLQPPVVPFTAFRRNLRRIVKRQGHHGLDISGLAVQHDYRPFLYPRFHRQPLNPLLKSFINSGIH